MREILFRGKREDKGKWAYGDYLSPTTLVPDTFISCEEVLNEYGDIGDVCYKVIPETVGQYTGLTDKNGNKIFEGDILRYSYEYEGSPWLKGRSLTDEDYRTGVVFWQYWRGSWAVCAHEKNQNINQDVYVYCRNPNRVEIIGNIHDNPELLEDER